MAINSSLLLNRLLPYALFAVIIQNAESARILGLFPHTGKSHQMVFDPLLRALAERGHELTVVSFFPIKNPPVNYTSVSLEGLSQLGVEVINLAEEYERPNPVPKFLGLQKIIKDMREFQRIADIGLDTCSKILDFLPLAEALKKNYDVVVTEEFNSDCVLGLAHVYGQTAPLIRLSSCVPLQWIPDSIGLTDNPSYVPVVSSDYTANMTFGQRLENTVLNIYYKLWYRYAIQLKEQALIERHFGKKIPDLQELAKNVSLLLVNTFHSLNGVRPLLPGVVEVGGMHLDHSQKPIPQYIERFLNESEHGVVLFSWGSLIRTATMSKQKEDIITGALSKLKQRVIWKHEDSAEEGTLEGNIFKVKWIPQFQLLQHPKVVALIAHGGLLGMTEAVSAGKPMLIVPFYGDQPHNGARAVELGIGRVLPYADFTEDSLLESLQDVLSTEMRQKAQLVSKIWHDRFVDPLETAVYWVERVTRWGHLDALHSAARDLNFIEYNSLDVFAVIVIAILLLVTFVRLLLRQCLRLICRKQHRKEKIH